MLRTEARPITAADYRDLPPGPPYYQLIEGDLYMAPCPDLFHQDIVLVLARLIGNYLDRNPIGSVHISPSDVQFSDLNVFQPDLYFVSRSRKSILSKQGAEGAPDLVVEVLSPKTAKLDKGVKRDVYARTGVDEMWLVDPAAKRIQIFRLDESTWESAAVFSGRQMLPSRTFPGLKIPVAKVFQQ
jgi:Uma2 family endonuclease